MRLKLNIETADGAETTVPVRPRTQVAYERHFKTQLNSDIGMEQLYWLGWHSSGTVEKFDRWLDGVESITAVVDNEDDDGEIDPLVETPPSGTSLPSPSNQGQESH